EEGNVIQENVEPAWYDRDYMRVDWSRNLSDFGFSLAGLNAQVLGWSTGDDRSALAPQFDDSDGDGTIDSLMLEQQVMLQPNTTVLPGYGAVPVCLFYGQAEYDCAATEVSVVSSFVRADDRVPYEGLAYDDRHMETFGYFSTQRLAYERAYGLVEPNRTRWANRHRLFEQSYRTDESGEMLCRKRGVGVQPCSTFSPEDEPKPVLLPVAERALTPIVYHAGPDFPEDLKETMQLVAEDWNTPLADAVNGLLFWECVEAGGRNPDCRELERDDLQMFVFCPNNPSLPDDPAICNTDHTGPDHRPDGVPDEVRLGDLRYSIAHVFDDAQIRSPFGYGPSAADPIGTLLPLSGEHTMHLGAGEIVSGTAYVYGHVLDLVSHQVADLVQLLNGEMAADQFVEGENVYAWVDALRNGTSQDLAGRTAGMPEAWSKGEVAERLGEISNGFAHQLAELHDTPRPTDPAAFEEFMAHAGDVMQRSGAFGAGQAGAQAAFDALMASPHTDLLWSDDAVGMMGFDPSTTSPSDLAGRSPLELVDPSFLAERDAGLVLAGQHAVDLDDGAFTDSSLVGLALHYAELGWSYEQIVADVRKQTFREVMLHEVGHTLGLRHNFAGSFDAINYRPEYWDLRQADGTVLPRHVDPETDAEREGRIREFQYSTIMDYPGARNVGWAGLGHYDEAAVKFGYAGLVEVFTEVPEEESVPGLPNDVALHYMATYNMSNVYPSVLLWYNDGSILQMHYTQYPGIAGNMEARADVPLDRLESVLAENGTFGDGLAVIDDGGGVKAGFPAVPYRFCSDEFALGITCARFDSGADPYEAHQFLFERYVNDYVLNNFSRERYGFGNAPAYVSRLNARTFRPLRTWQRYFALFHGLFDAETDPNAAEYFAADNGFGGWTAATDESFRFLTQVITRPEPGAHRSITRPDGTEVLSPSTTGATDVPLISGAYYESEWNFDSGYHWFERQTRIGSYWDRMLALLTLTNTASTGFLGFDTAIDPRNFAIGYQDLYRDQLAVVLGELLADEVDRLAPAVTDDGQMLYPDPMAPDAAWPPADTRLVQPGAYWLVQYDAGLFGKALLNHGYDRSFINRSRMYVEGTGDAVTPAPDQPTVSFVDPVSGKTFTAWSFPLHDDDGQPVLDESDAVVELGSSARMVRKAQAVSDRCLDVGGAACSELQRLSADLDLQLQLNNAFETAAPQ
ncbi:MAG: zinc-dependent metalloprotease, partial [Myxococcales bacterium]|nr:zinc-dependent metalloprotease [Myxococcales bacterium]